MSKAGVNGISSILLRSIRENIGSIHFSSLGGYYFLGGKFEAECVFFQNMYKSLCNRVECTIGRSFVIEQSLGPNHLLQ